VTGVGKTLPAGGHMLPLAAWQRKTVYRHQAD